MSIYYKTLQIITKEDEITLQPCTHLKVQFKLPDGIDRTEFIEFAVSCKGPEYSKQATRDLWNRLLSRPITKRQQEILNIKKAVGKKIKEFHANTRSDSSREEDRVNSSK